MKLLLDENISQTLTRNLQDCGFFVLHVLDADIRGSSDEEILKFANKRKMVIITHDKDFGNLIRFPLASHNGVILLRFKNQRSENVFPYLLNFLKDRKDLKSHLVILKEGGYRKI